MATDMRKPPGVIMWRNGEAVTTSCNARNSDGAPGKAKPRNTTAPCPSDSRSDPAVKESSNKSIDATELLRIVKNHTERMAMPRANPAHTVAHVHPIHATHALNGTMVNREDHRVALAQRDYLGP